MKGLLDDLLGPTSKAGIIRPLSSPKTISKEGDALAGRLRNNPCIWRCPQCNVEIFTTLPVMRCPACGLRSSGP